MSNFSQIVCIDDEPGIIELVSLVLKSEDIQVVGARNGSEGLSLMRENPPDAVLLDIMMPDMDGWEVYKQIRADETLKNLPVIILTARTSSFEEVIARERVGVNDYLTKPFMPDELRSSLAKILAPQKS